MSSSAVHLLEAAHENMRALLEAIEESDGVITEEQENQLKWLVHNEELALGDIGKEIVNLEERAEALRQTRKKWNDTARKSITDWEERAGKFRAYVRDAMVEYKKQHKKSTLRSPDASVSLTLRANNKGTLVIDDPALDKETHVRGYTQEQVLKSGLPPDVFTAHKVYLIDKEKVRALAEGKKVDTAKITKDPTLAIKLAG